MNKYDFDIANGDISGQEYIRPNSDMFNNFLTILTYSYYTQSNLQGNSKCMEINGTLRTKILEYL